MPGSPACNAMPGDYTESEMDTETHELTTSYEQHLQDHMKEPVALPGEPKGKSRPIQFLFISCAVIIHVFMYLLL